MLDYSNNFEKKKFLKKIILKKNNFEKKIILKKKILKKK